MTETMTQQEALTEAQRRGWHCPWAECVPRRDDDWRSGKLYRIGSQYKLRGESSDSWEAAFADAERKEKHG